MTPAEFKAWFEGFCEAITDAPTPEQWEKIKQRVAAIGGAQVIPFIPSHIFPDPSVKPAQPFETICKGGLSDAPATMS